MNETMFLKKQKYVSCMMKVAKNNYKKYPYFFGGVTLNEYLCPNNLKTKL